MGTETSRAVLLVLITDVRNIMLVKPMAPSESMVSLKLSSRKGRSRFGWSVFRMYTWVLSTSGAESSCTGHQFSKARNLMVGYVSLHL